MNANYMKARTARKALSVLVIAAMIITSLSIPAISSKAYAATKTTRTTTLDLDYISSTNTQGAEYSSATDTYTCDAEGWTWNAKTKVLTLDGTTIDTSAATNTEIDEAALGLPAGSTIKLVSDSTVICGKPTGDDELSAAIYSDADLTIEGAGKTLTAISGEAEYSYGIISYDGRLIVATDTTVVATGGTATTEYSAGISPNGIVNYGTIKATGGASTAARSWGVYSYKGDIVNYGTMKCNGTASTEKSYGIRCRDGNIVNKGYMYGRGGDSTKSSSYGIYVEDGDITNYDFIEGVSGVAAKASCGIELCGNITNESQMWACADDAYGMSAGIYVAESDTDNTGNLVNGKDGEILSYGETSTEDYSMGIMTEGSFTNDGDARGFASEAGLEASASDTADADDMDSIGINAQGGVVNSGYIVARGDKSRDYTDGLYSAESIVNKEGASIAASAQVSKGKSYAIEADNTLTNDGNIKAEGADEGTSYGISADTVVFNGVDTLVEACGAKAAVHASTLLSINDADGLKVTGGTENMTASGTDLVNQTGANAAEFVRISRAKDFLAQGTAAKKSVTITWNETNDAWTYKVYMAKCGTSKWNYVKSVNDTTTVTFKKLKAGTSYKAYVVAYNENGQQIDTTPYVFVITTGGKYSNATKVRAESTLTASKNSESNVNAKITSKSSNKTLLYKGRCAKLRYFSADESIARVSSTGKIIVLKKGTVSIYSVAPSGAYAETVVTTK